MDPLGNNKVFAAILGGALVFMMIRMLPEVFMHHDAPKVPAYIVGELESSGEVEEIELPFPQAEWVAAMDIERGAKVFKNCTSCHNAEVGGANGTGPGLWNVVGAAPAQHEGFAYSDAMASVDYVWDFEHLDGFLEKPKKYMPGTKMNFAGIRKESDRAAVIEYLRLASDNPMDRPEPAAATIELTVEAETATVPAEDLETTVSTVDPTDTEVVTPEATEEAE